jgi:subtilisin family serine protease
MELVVLSGGTILSDKTTTNLTSSGVTYSLLTGDLKPGNYEIAVENLSGPDPGLLKVILGHSQNLMGLSGSIVGENAGTIHGHTMTSGVIVAGAANWNTVASGAMNEDFSASRVGTELLFDENGNPLAAPQVLSPIAITGVDGMATSVFKNFVGTSAAAPTIAGIVALMLQANPKLTSQEVNEILQATAMA